MSYTGEKLRPPERLGAAIAKVDLVKLIDSRVPLQKHGDEYRACCPFHDEKTPSFVVFPDTNLYHCYGCGEHGNALGFLMKHDNLDYIEAVDILTDHASAV